MNKPELDLGTLWGTFQILPLGLLWTESSEPGNGWFEQVAPMKIIKHHLEYCPVPRLMPHWSLASLAMQQIAYNEIEWLPWEYSRLPLSPSVKGRSGKCTCTEAQIIILPYMLRGRAVPRTKIAFQQFRYLYNVFCVCVCVFLHFEFDKPGLHCKVNKCIGLLL